MIISFIIRDVFFSEIYVLFKVLRNVSQRIPQDAGRHSSMKLIDFLLELILNFRRFLISFT